MNDSALFDPVLVLNKHWVPISACTAQKALSIVTSDKAQIVCPDTFVLHDMESWMDLPVDTGRFIKSARSSVRIPEVIVNKYGKVPVRRVVFSRRNLWKRDKFTCQYCGIRPRADEITVDHVVPKHQGGRTTFDNCVLACVNCNKKKDNRTPEQAGMPLRRLVSRDAAGVKKFEVYHRPKAPAWSPVYAIKRSMGIPKSWAKFMEQLRDDLYWNIELEE